MAWQDNVIENREETIVVNTAGGPGAGKSTTSALVFGILKSVGINAELATEYAKDKTWEGSQHILVNQPYVLGKQIHRLWRLDGKVEVIITDSPLFLSAIYNTNTNHGQELDALALKLFNDFENINYLMERVKAYNPKGRSQTEDEAKQVDTKVKDFMDTYGIDYTIQPGTPEGACAIASEIYYRLRGKRMKVQLLIDIED